MRHHGASYLMNDGEAQELFRELRKLYHCVDYNGENGWTLPPIDGEAHFKRTTPLRNIVKYEV